MEHWAGSLTVLRAPLSADHYRDMISNRKGDDAHAR
jgi:hypothetical protein